jgi:23S rRNA (pseudouridine1915-N3)-methyltransferase
MMIRVISIGKTNISYVKEGLDEYTSRLKHYTKLSWEELPDIKKIDRNNQALLIEKEGEAFLSAIDSREAVYLLDDGGKAMDSVQFSNWINQHQIYDQSNLVLIIGGAYGFSESLVKRSKGKISLSKMTFNHQMVRLILAEQLYRAFTIIKGEPYHHS